MKLPYCQNWKSTSQEINIANDLLPQKCLAQFSTLPGRHKEAKRLGLAHQRHNGAGAGILDLSYSWDTMSTTGTNSEQLMQSAPQITHTCECVCAWEGTHTRIQHRSQRLLGMPCRKSNHHHSNLIWVQSVLTAISVIKTVRYTASLVQRFWATRHLLTEGQSEGGCRRCIIGNLLNDNCSDDIHS